MKFINPPNILKKIYKNLIWDIPNEENKVFLTIDDCQSEDVTRRILDVLDEFKIKATFFCCGKNVEFNNLHNTILDKGHRVGNHGFEHISGYKTSLNDYVSNVYKCNQIIDSNLYRPPYGKITFRQSNTLKITYKIIMWDIMTYDFDLNTTPIECFENVKEYVKSGSIIVFHANDKAKRNVMFALPYSIEYLLKKGFSFSVID